MTYKGRRQSHSLSEKGVKSSTQAQLSRFLIVGLANGAAGFLLFIVFFRVLGFNYLLANMSVFVTWAWFGFELQRRWTFKAEASRVSFGKFIINQIAFLALGSLIMGTLVELFAAPPELAYVITLAVVTSGIYLSSLRWVFR